MIKNLVNKTFLNFPIYVWLAFAGISLNILIGFHIGWILYLIAIFLVVYAIVTE